MRRLMVDTLPPLVVQRYFTETDLRRVVSWRVTQVHGLVSSGCHSRRGGEGMRKATKYLGGDEGTEYRTFF